MDYKCLIKSKMPECLYPAYLKYKYKKDLGKKCNIDNPETFSEKMQWAKIHRRDPLITQLADKFLVREFVKERIGEDYLIPMIGGPYSCAGEINFGELPDSFVIKANHGCGFNLIVNDKNTLDIASVCKKLNGWLKEKIAFNYLELQYKDINPVLFIEKNLLDSEIKDLPDYKFFCFDGKVYCSYVMINTYPVHKNAKLGIFDRDFTLLPYHRADFKPIPEQIDKPENYEKMVEIAEKLSEGFSHVRVDLYNTNGKIYFGEMTFTTAGGFFKHEPEEFDWILGDKWDLNSGI